MATATKTKPQRKVAVATRGSTLLKAIVDKLGSYEKATEELNKVVGGEYLRASLWHWATGQHKPGRAAAAALEAWKKIPIPAWDEPPRV